MNASNTRWLLLIGFALAFAMSSESSAQVGVFQEIAVPSDSAILHVPNHSYYRRGQVFVQITKQKVAFDTKITQVGLGEPYSRLEVRLADGAWTTLYSGSYRTGVVQWTPPSLALGINAAEVRIRVNDPLAWPYYRDFTYQFDIVAVPDANGTANVTKQKTVCVGNCNGGGSGAVSSDAVTASVETAESSGAPVFAFEPAFPNPAGLSANGRARMTMRFNLPESAPARLSLYDALGREVAVLLDDIAHEGTTDVSLDVATLPAGVYTARLAAGDRVAIQRVTVVR